MYYRDTERTNLQATLTDNRMQYLLRYINNKINSVFSESLNQLTNLFNYRYQDGKTEWDYIVDELNNIEFNSLTNKRNYVKSRLESLLNENKRTIKIFKMNRRGRYQISDDFVNDIMSYYRNNHPEEYSDFLNSNVRQLNNSRFVFYPYTDNDFKAVSFLNDFQKTINTVAMKLKKGTFANYFKSPYVSLLMKNNQYINFDYFIKNNIQNFSTFLDNANVVIHPHQIQYWGSSGCSVMFPQNFVPQNNARIFEGFSFGFDYDIDKLVKHLIPSLSRVIKNPYNSLTQEIRPLIPTYGTSSIYYINYDFPIKGEFRNILNNIQMYDNTNLTCISKHCLLHSFDYFIKSELREENKAIIRQLRNMIQKFMSENRLMLENVNIDCLFGNKREYLNDNKRLREYLNNHSIKIEVRYEGLNRLQTKLYGPKGRGNYISLSFFVLDKHIMPFYTTIFNYYHFRGIVPFFFFEDDLKNNFFIRYFNIDIYNTSFMNTTARTYIECNDRFSNLMFGYYSGMNWNKEYKTISNRFRCFFRVFKLFVYMKFSFLYKYNNYKSEFLEIFNQYMDVSLIKEFLVYVMESDLGSQFISEYELRNKLKKDFIDNIPDIYLCYLRDILNNYIYDDISYNCQDINYMNYLIQSLEIGNNLNDFEVYILFSIKDILPPKITSLDVYNYSKEIGYIKKLDENKYYVIQELKVNNVLMNKLIVPKIDNDLIDIEQKPDEKTNKKLKNNYLLGFCDFETSSSKEYHKPFMVILFYQNNNIIYSNDFHKKEFIGINCNKEFMEFLFNVMVGHNAEEFICYTHNLMYDSRFFREFDCISYIEKTNRCYQQIHIRDIMGKQRTIIFKDFLSMTNTALKNIPSWFKGNPVFENIKKEYMFYETMDICYDNCLIGNIDCRIYISDIIQFACSINKLPDSNYLLALLDFFKIGIDPLYNEVYTNLIREFIIIYINLNNILILLEKDNQRLINLVRICFHCFHDNCPFEVYEYYFREMDFCNLTIEEILCLGYDIPYFSGFVKRRIFINNKIYINYMEYVRFYCHQDVYILAYGFINFNNLIKQSVMNLNIVDFLTSPSMSKNYFQNKLFYNTSNKHTYKCSGCLQQFLLQCCHGGKCMTKRNRKIRVQNGKVFNIDCNSLYPSAMSTMYIVKNIKFSPVPDYYTIDTFNSFHLPDFFLIWLHVFIIKLENKIQIDKCLLEKYINNINEEPPFYIYGFALRIEITKINKFYSFPAIVRKTKEGKANTNSIGECYITDIGLFDLLTFHDIEFKIKEGCYFIDYKKDLTNVEFTIQNNIIELYNMRRKYKKEKNPMELCVKLLLNSGYGSLMQKPIGTEIEIVDDTSLNERLKSLNEDWKSVEQLTDTNNEFINKYIIKKVKDKSKHFNHAYIAASVLAKSKHIMHKVMFLAEDNDIDIYYTDTDSIHMDGSKYDYLRELYFDKFNRELNGSDLQQFHNDFEVNNGVYDNVDSNLLKEIDTNSDLYADNAIYLGKKMYCERIRSFRFPDEIGINFKLKGIPEEVIINHANNNYSGDNEVERIFNLYLDIYNGNEVTFDLLSTRVRFKIGHSIITNVKSFTRKIKTRYSELTNTPILKDLSKNQREGDDLCILAERLYSTTTDLILCRDIKYELDEYKCLRNYPKDIDDSFLELDNQTVVTSYIDVDLTKEPEETIITIDEDNINESDYSYEEN